MWIGWQRSFPNSARRWTRDRLVEASKSASIRWAQRLGYLLEQVGAGDKAELLKEHVRKRARNFAKLLPATTAENAPRSGDWQLYVNADIETEP